MKLINFLKQTGIGSRRKCMEYFDSGLVLVNNKKVESVFCEIDEQNDTVTYKNKPLQIENFEYFIMNKPQGYVCSNADQYNPKLVVDLIPSKSRLFTVGRLDKMTTGLLIITNDGDLSNKIIHPSKKIKKTYDALIEGRISEQDIINFSNHISHLGKIYFKVVETKRINSDTQVLISIEEGKKHIIRKFFKYNGYKIKQLSRVAIGGLKLNNLKPGRYKKVSKNFLLETVF